MCLHLCHLDFSNIQLPNNEVILASDTYEKSASSLLNAGFLWDWLAIIDWLINWLIDSCYLIIDLLYWFN
jgi:hypothetical protein